MDKKKFKVTDQGDARKYFTIIPNTIIKGEKGNDLHPLAKLLYIYLKSVAGENGQCYQTTRTIEENLGISRSSVTNFKKELLEAGLVRITKQKDRPGVYQSDIITITDIWQKNVQEFSKDTPGHDIDRESKPGHDIDNPGHDIDNPGHVSNNPGHLTRHNKNPSNKNPNKKNSHKKSSSSGKRGNSKDPEKLKTEEQPSTVQANSENGELEPPENSMSLSKRLYAAQTIDELLELWIEYRRVIIEEPLGKDAKQLVYGRMKEWGLHFTRECMVTAWTNEYKGLKPYARNNF